MTLIKHEIEVPKESKEVIDLLSAVVDNIVAKKALPEYSNLIDELMLAIDGAALIADEVKSKYKSQIITYAVEKVVTKVI